MIIITVIFILLCRSLDVIQLNKFKQLTLQLLSRYTTLDVIHFVRIYQWKERFNF